MVEVSQFSEYHGIALYVCNVDISARFGLVLLPIPVNKETPPIVCGHE